MGLEETSLLARVHPAPWRGSLLTRQCRGHAWDFRLDHCCPRAPSPSLAPRSGAGSTLSLDGRSAHLVQAPYSWFTSVLSLVPPPTASVPASWQDRGRGAVWATAVVLPPERGRMTQLTFLGVSPPSQHLGSLGRGPELSVSRPLGTCAAGAGSHAGDPCGAGGHRNSRIWKPR